MTPDEALGAYFSGQMPASRDLAFETRVAERIARRRLIATGLALLPWTVAILVGGWAVGPLMAPAFESLVETLSPAAALLGMTVVGVWSLMAGSRRLAPR